MSSIECAFVTKAIEEADVKTPIKSRITPGFLLDETCRSVFEYLCDKWQEYGKVPSIKLVQREFPDFEPEDTDDDLIMLIDQVKRERLYADMSKITKEIAEATIDDPQEGLSKLKAAASRLALEHSRTDDSNLSKEAKVAWKDYKRRKKGIDSYGIPWPWDYMNMITRGMHGGDLLAFYSRPKSLKTFLSLFVSNNAHEQYGTVVGFASCEMSKIQIRDRLTAMRAKVPYKNFRAGDLTRIEERRVKRVVQEMYEAPPFPFFKPQEVGDAFITEMRAKIEEYELEFLVVDGFYNQMEEESHRAFRKLTRGLKRLAETCKIPILCTTQANRSAEKNRGKDTTEVGFGDSLAQDCDFLGRIIREPVHRENKELLITMPALREAEGGTFLINAIPCTDFSQKQIIEDEEELHEDESEEIAA